MVTGNDSRLLMASLIIAIQQGSVRLENWHKTNREPILSNGFPVHILSYRSMTICVRLSLG